jgi:high-affinity Fe2+/Pb2+ permease
MKNKKEYTFLEWVFEIIGFSKFILYYFFVMLIIAVMVLSFVWWYTKK